jgi:hypothetical protein
VLLVLSALGGCQRQPELYRPPIQRRPYEIVEPKSLGHYATMNAPNALDHVVSGVLPELHDGRWRWTLQEPVLQFRVPRTNGLKFQMEYTVPQVTFKETGPVKIEIVIGACALDVIDVQKDLVGTHDKEVPPSCLTVDRPVVVRMKVDKVWTGADDRQPRGFILTSAGFVE